MFLDLRAVRMNREEARQLAIGYLHTKVIGYGVTRERLRSHPTEGFVGPGKPGYDLSHGKITVPANIRPGPLHTFATDDLVNEIEQGQGDLFA